MIALVIGAALAETPDVDVALGWSGSNSQGYAFATCDPTLARSEDAGLVLTGTVSEQYYRTADPTGTTRVTSPGASLGVGLTYAPNRLALELSTSFELRRTTREHEGSAPATEVEAGATLGAGLYWQADRRTNVYADGTFSGANRYLWTQFGATHQILPLVRRDPPVSLWAGLEASAHGNADARALEGGIVFEVPVRPIHTSFRVRGGYGAEDDGNRITKLPSVGFGLYWSY